MWTGAGAASPGELGDGKAGVWVTATAGDDQTGDIGVVAVGETLSEGFGATGGGTFCLAAWICMKLQASAPKLR